MKKFFTLLLMVLALNKLSAQCSANFSYTLNPSGSVTFSNTSTFTGTNVSYLWDFGDYSPYSNAVNPTYAYSGNGIYVVKLQMFDSIPPNSCFNMITQTITITNTVCLVSASISTIQSSNGVVYFGDASTGTLPNTTYTLDFGDNTSPNVFGAHTYSASGIYTISLTEANSPGCSNTYSNVINVIVQSCSLTANFTFSVNAGLVTFSDTSVGTSSSTTYYWNFGSNQQFPPSQTYTSNGIYSVTLMIQDSIIFNCYSSVTKTVLITNAACYVNSNFVLAKDSTQIPAIVWNAYPSYALNVVSAVWSWGDNTSTTALYPSHTYSAAGMYSVCLTVSVSCGSTSTTCFSAQINRGGEANQIATIHVINLSTGIKTQEKALLSNFMIYPNPNTGMFSIKNLNNDYQSLIIYNQLGQEAYSKNVSDLSDVNLDLDLPNGIYFMQLSSGSSKQTKKIIIQK